MHLYYVVRVVSDSLQPNGLARQAPLSMGFSRQEYWGGLPFPSPGDLPDPGIKPGFLHLLHFRQIIYHLSHKGSPRILEWVAYPFSSRSSQNRDLTQVFSRSLFCLPYPKRTPSLSLKALHISFLCFFLS